MLPNDNGLDWDYTRTEFRQALLDCVTATNDGSLLLLQELRACSLLMLHFRDRLSLQQQRALSDLADVAAFPEFELGRNDDEPEFDDELTRGWLEGAIKQARASKPLFEGI